METLLALSICKASLFLAYPLYIFVWHGVFICNLSFVNFNIFTFLFLSTFGIGVFMLNLRVGRTGAIVFSLIEYIFLGVSQAFYIGSYIIFECKKSQGPHPLFVSLWFLAIGILAFIQELYFGVCFLKQLLNDEAD